jgi:thiol-disulfide isomerase/thioredoxin
MPDDALPASGDIAPASYSQGGEGPADGDIVAPPRKTSNVRRGSRAASSATRRSRDAGASQDPSDPDSPAEDSPTRSGPSRRPTWRELSISPDDVPVDEALRRSSGEDDGDDRGAVVLADGRSSGDDVEEAQGRGVIEKPKPRRVRPPAGSQTATQANRSKAAASGSLEAVCRMDPGHRRVLELELPDLEGKMVSLRDIDADIIVLDFWGSWCIQCRKSIEHHRQLQQEFGDKKVQVIGIACEEAATFEGRRATAAAAAKKFGINYPVLVTAKEGNCPVQGALRVQFYPTMVVLDREGNILQFEQGATDATLGRVDRVIAKSVDQEVDSRR